MTESAFGDSLPQMPYPGIEPFSYAHRAVFFGREAETRSLVRLIAMYRGVLLYSESGGGKSSLLNAAVIPAAIKEGFQPERVRVQPKLDQELVVERVSHNVDDTPPYLPSALTQNESARTIFSADGFLAAIRGLEPSIRPLLIFDQFEEWVTLFQEGSSDESLVHVRESRQRICNVLVSLISSIKSPCKVLISLRQEYLANLAPIFERCPQLPDQHVLLEPLPASAVVRIVRGPFDRYPGQYSPELSLELARAVEGEFEERARAGELRLTEIQIVCRDLYDEARGGADPMRVFQDGGVQGLLERHLQRFLRSLPASVVEPAVALLTRMITSAGTRNVISEADLIRRVALEDELSEPVLRDALRLLEQRTKLVRSERRREVQYYEISSEFLVDWIRAQADQRRQDQIERAEKRADNYRNLLESLQRHSNVVKEQANVAAAINCLQTDPERSIQLALDAVATIVTPDGIDVLNRAIHASRVQLICAGHADEVKCVSFSPNGDILVSGSSDGTIRIWSRLGAELTTLQAHEGGVVGIAISADGRQIASVGWDGLLLLWDVASGTVLTRIEHPDPFQGVTFLGSAAARVATISSGGALGFWDLTSGEAIWSTQAHSLGGSGLAFDGNNTLVSCGRDRLCKLWSVSSRRLRATFEMHTSEVFAVACSPDRKSIASAGMDRSIKLFDATTGRVIANLKGHTNTVFGVAFPPRGHAIASASADCTARIWDVASGSGVVELHGHTNPVNAVAFSPDGERLATGSWDGTVRVWDTSVRHTGGVVAAKFTTDGTRLLTASRDGTARVWDVESRREVYRTPAQSDEVTVFDSSPDNRHFATASYYDQTVRVWNGESRKLVAVLNQQGATVAVKFHPSRSHLAIAYKDGVLIWDISARRKVRTLGEGDTPSAIAYGDEGKALAVGTESGGVRVYAADDGRELYRFETGASVGCIRFFSSDRRLLVANNAGSVLQWDADVGAITLRIDAHDKLILQLVLAEKSRRFVTSSMDNLAKLWDLATGALLHTFSEHTGPVDAVDILGDGSRVATGSWDRTACVWESTSGEMVLRFRHAREVSGVVFSPDGRFLATTSEDATFRVNWLNVRELQAVGRDRLTRLSMPAAKDAGRAVETA